MGWGISIDQDENGCVYCEDADFQTGIEDYGDECPPSSYDFIYEKVEDDHGTIDSARNHSGIDMANEECHGAFNCAKSCYEDLEDDEKLDMHDLWIENTRGELAKCVFDETKEAEVLKSIEDWNAANRETLNELERKCMELNQQIKKLEFKLGEVRRPKVERQRLLNLLNIEDLWFMRNYTESAVCETESH